jgi:hypothetical protein
MEYGLGTWGSLYLEGMLYVYIRRILSRAFFKFFLKGTVWQEMVYLQSILPVIKNKK